MKNFNVFFSLLAFLLSTSLTAQQVTLKTPDMTVEPGANIHLDVQVENFDLITGVQFSINWDSQVLEFIGVDNFGLPNMTADDNFGVMEVAQGKLRFSWYQLELTGVTVPDMSQIFSIWFKVIGAPNASSAVTISNEPIVIEVVNTQGVVPVTVVSGTITVNGPNASTEAHTSDFVLFQNSPNPFRDVTFIRFNLNKSTQTTLSIYDNSGKAVFEKTEFLASGPHSIPIKRDLFQSTGTYFFSLKTDQATATRQLIAQ